jgi:hypothetical protein
MQTKVSNAFAMSASGRAEWKIALVDCGMGDRATFVKAVITVVSRPTAERAFDGGYLERQTWEEIFKELDLQRSNFFTEAEWWQWDLLTLWGMLWNLGEDASDRFGLVRKGSLETSGLCDGLEGLRDEKKFLGTVSSGSKVLVEMSERLAGHLILVEQDSTGLIELLAPSALMLDSELKNQVQRLPQHPPSKFPCLIPQVIGTT